MAKTLSPLYVHKRCGDHHLSLDGEWWLASSDLPADPAQGVELGAMPTNGWMSVSVPGTVQWQLYQAGVLPHPYRERNSTQYTWVEERAWWYRRSFAVPAGWQGKSVSLAFDALDYHAWIWLNGRLLGSHDGAFGGPDFDVTELLHPHGPILAEPITGTLTFSEPVTVYALDLHGRRDRVIGEDVDKLLLTPDNFSLWYEIVINS